MDGNGTGHDERRAGPPPRRDHLTAPLRLLSGGGLIPQSCRARVLKASQSRPVWRYVLTYQDRGDGAPARRVVVGKGYYRGDGTRAFEAMSQLWADGFSKDGLTIPEPLAYDHELGLLLQDWASGKPLYSYLTEPAAALGFVRLTARWLAKLHGASIAGAAVLEPGQEGGKLSAHCAALARACSGSARRLEGLTGRIAASLDSLRPWRAVPTHGDFQPKNIHVRRDRITVIDFDHFALAPPERDLGHFIAQCMTMSYARTGSFREIESWNTAFLDEYVRLAPSGALPALPLFIARAFLDVLHYKLVVRPVKDPSFLPAWLDECERQLDGVPITGSSTDDVKAWTHPGAKGRQP